MEHWFKYSYAFLSSGHNVVVVACPLMSSTFTVDTETQLERLQKMAGKYSSRLQPLPWYTQYHGTSVLLELVRIAINIIVGICIPVVIQPRIKVTCIPAAQIVLVYLRLRCHFYATNGSISVLFLYVYTYWYHHNDNFVFTLPRYEQP